MPKVSTADDITVDGIANSIGAQAQLLHQVGIAAELAGAEHHDLGLVAELLVGASGEFVGRQLEQRARAADVAELQFHLRERRAWQRWRPARLASRVRRFMSCLLGWVSKADAQAAAGSGRGAGLAEKWSIAAATPLVVDRGCRTASGPSRRRPAWPARSGRCCRRGGRCGTCGP